MQKILNVRISLLVLGLMMTLLGLGNLVGAEDWAKDQWTGAQGRELDIATSVELAWGQNRHCRADDLDSQFHLERGSEGAIRRDCDRAFSGWRDFHCEFAVS